MKSEKRHAQILQLLRHHGFVTVAEISRQLKVSNMTIRRDLDVLQGMGLITRSHGGASLTPERGDVEWPLMLRLQEQMAQKHRIGQRAAQFVRSGDVVILDGGTTTLAVAQHLTQDRLTVVTNCLPILSAISSLPNIKLMSPGGMFYVDNQCFIGPVTVQSLKSVNANVVFVGTSGLSLDHGMTNRKFEEAETKRAMLEAAAQKILVMDSSKMHTHTLATVGPIDVIDILVTDDGLSAADKASIESRGVQVVIA